MNTQIIIKVFENDQFLVSTDFETFKLHMTKCLSKHAHLSEDRELLNLIEQQTNINGETIDAITVSDKYRLYSRLT